MKNTITAIGILAAAVTLVIIAYRETRWLPDRLDAMEARLEQETAAAPADDTALIEIQNKLESIRFELEKIRGDDNGANPDKKIEEIIERLDELASQVYEVDRETQRNLVTLQSNILRRLSQLRSAAAPAHSTDPIELKKQLKADGVELNLTERRVRIRGRIVAPRQPLEVIAATDGGPLHESLLHTTAKPGSLRRALLELGAKAGGGADYRTGVAPHGQRLWIYVQWEGLDRPWRLEDCLLDLREENQTMIGAKWVFTGSELANDFQTGEEYLLADLERVAISLTHNRSHSAIIGCDHKDSNNENIWVPNQMFFGELGDVELTLTISLERIDALERSEVTRPGEDQQK